MSLSDKQMIIELTGNKFIYSKDVKEALINYIKKKAEGFKKFKQGKITLNQLRLRLMEIEEDIFGKELLKKQEKLIKYPSKEYPNPLKEQDK
jgi:hypothetical protein